MNTARPDATSRTRKPRISNNPPPTSEATAIAQPGQGQAHAADVCGRRSEGSELAEAAHEKQQTDKHATNQWQKSCNFHVRLPSRCLLGDQGLLGSLFGGPQLERGLQ